MWRVLWLLRAQQKKTSLHSHLDHTGQQTYSKCHSQSYKSVLEDKRKKKVIIVKTFAFNFQFISLHKMHLKEYLLTDVNNSVLLNSSRYTYILPGLFDKIYRKFWKWQFVCVQYEFESLILTNRQNNSLPPFILTTMPTILIIGRWFFSFMLRNRGNGAKKSSQVTVAAELMLDTLMLENNNILC